MSEQCGRESSLLLALLQATDELHSAKAELNACLKQGFFNLTKARRSSSAGGHSAGFTVLDAREEVHTLYRVHCFIVCFCPLCLA
jgi:hypothetical protein